MIIWHRITALSSPASETCANGVHSLIYIQIEAKDIAHSQMLEEDTPPSSRLQRRSVVKLYRNTD